MKLKQNPNKNKQTNKQTERNTKTPKKTDSRLGAQISPAFFTTDITRENMNKQNSNPGK